MNLEFDSYLPEERQYYFLPEKLVIENYIKPKHRDVVYGLCLPRDLKSLLKRNNLIRKNVMGNYDLIIFHAGEFSNEQEARVLANTPQIRFVNISNEWNRNMSGYKNMCEFYSWKVWKHLEGYELALRLDDDSFVTTRVDPFQIMRQKKGVYGYSRRKVDWHQPTIDTLHKLVKRFYKIPNDHFCIENFYNNFNISEVAFWSRPDVLKFLDMIRRENGVREHRWGDSNIQAIAAKLFLPPEKILEISCGYDHGSHAYSNKGGTNPMHEW